MYYHTNYVCTVYLFLYSITALAPYMCNYRSAVFFPDLRLRDPDQMSLNKALRGFPQGARTWGKSTAAAGQTSLGKLWANNPLENKYHFIPTQCNWPPHIRSTIDPNGSINSYINSISFPRSFLSNSSSADKASFCLTLQRITYYGFVPIPL